MEDEDLPWKSSIDPYYSWSKYLLYSSSILIALIPFIIFLCIIGLNTLAVQTTLDFFWLIQIVFLIIAFIPFWVGLKFKYVYLEIHDNGIYIRKPIYPFKQYFYRFDEIKRVYIGKMPKYYGSYNPDARMGHRLHIGFSKLVIVPKMGKPVWISSAWVFDTATAAKIIRKNIQSEELKGFCKLCNREKSKEICDTCGLEVCKYCYEESECLICLSKRFNKRIGISFLISLIPCFIAIVRVILDDVNWFELFINAKGNLAAIYYMFSNIGIGITITSYAIGIWLAEFSLYDKLKKRANIGYDLSFYLSSIFIIVVILLKVSYAIQIRYSNLPDVITFWLVEIIIGLIVIIVVFYNNKQISSSNQ
jgi:hypothetical protein